MILEAECMRSRGSRIDMNALERLKRYDLYGKIYRKIRISGNVGKFLNMNFPFKLDTL